MYLDFRQSFFCVLQAWECSVSVPSIFSILFPGHSQSVWDFFTGNSVEKTAMCIICNMVLKIQPNSGVWNLKRHVSRLHPKEFERYSTTVIPSHSGSQHSILWSCFNRNREERTAVCKMCGLLFECNIKPTIKMKQHLIESHRSSLIDTLVKKE